MRTRLLTLLALIGLAGSTVPVHAQVLKGKEATKKASTNPARTKKDTAPGAAQITNAAATNKQEKSASKTKVAAEKKGTNKKMDQASPK